MFPFGVIVKRAELHQQCHQPERLDAEMARLEGGKIPIEPLCGIQFAGAVKCERAVGAVALIRLIAKRASGGRIAG